MSEIEKNGSIVTKENARAGQDTPDFHLLVKGPFSTCSIDNEKLIILFSSGLQPFLSGVWQRVGKSKLPYLKQCNNWLPERHFVFDFPKGIVLEPDRPSGPQGQPLAFFAETCLTYTHKIHTSTQHTHAKHSCRRGRRLCATEKKCWL